MKTNLKNFPNVPMPSEMHTHDRNRIIEWKEKFTKELQQLWDSGKIYELTADELHEEIFGQ